MAKKTDVPMMGVSGSIPVSLHEAMEDKRWDYRKNMSQFVRLGLETWAESIGIWTPETVTIDADDPELTDDQRAAIAADNERAEAAKAEQEAAAKAEQEAAAKAEADAKAAEEASDAGVQDAPEAESDKPAEEPTKTTSRSRK